MGRVGTFFLGFLLGGATVFLSLHYHLVRAHDGMHVVPKVTSTLSETYVDIRSFGFAEWEQHKALALALAKSGNENLLGQTVTQPLQDAVDGFLEPFQN